MVSELLTAIAVAGALTGAGLNAARSWYQAPETEKWSWKKFLGGMTSGGLAALGLINFLTIPEQSANGFIALFIANALMGAGASTGINQLHK